ncbi:MAG: hypothetical protein J5907_07620 [Bacteroidales bacterium]|nr:hypothetical protein [Bacteroidales bacterium]
MKRFAFYLTSLLALLALACNQIDEGLDLDLDTGSKQQKMNFDIMVTRDGQVVSKERVGVMTRGSVDTSDKLATMDEDIPFGLIGIDFEHNRLLIDNANVTGGKDGYSTFFDGFLWNGTEKVNLSAYYPRVGSVDYGEGYESYSIPYTVQETDAGPLVSKTVERAIDQLNMVPLVFQHITNDIGYKICDITPDKNLQGLIHLRKVTATNVASAGVYVNDVVSGSGVWHKQGYYRKVVVFEGDAKVGVGSENELFVGQDALVERMADSHRYYSIPDDIEIGKQCVEVVFDVEGFKHNNYYYEPLKNQVRKFMLYGLLPDNVFAFGKQYTFHIGLDLSSIYREITFAPAVADWETTIYENNEDF